MLKRQLIYLMIAAFFVPNAAGLGGERKGHVCFSLIDEDKDGKVTLQEFEKIFGTEQSKKFTEADLNQDGSLSHDEYHQSLGHGNRDS